MNRNINWSPMAGFIAHDVVNMQRVSNSHDLNFIVQKAVLDKLIDNVNIRLVDLRYRIRP